MLVTPCFVIAVDPSVGQFSWRLLVRVLSVRELRIVVGGAVIRSGRLLAARRSAPPEMAGRWEFPGGKVEPGEGPEEALVRELQEELGIEVRVGARLRGESVLRPGLVLRFWAAELVRGEPQPLQDHDELRWLAADELDDVDWLPQDRVVLGEVAELLAAREATAATPRVDGS